MPGEKQSKALDSMGAFTEKDNLESKNLYVFHPWCSNLLCVAVLKITAKAT